MRGNLNFFRFILFVLLLTVQFVRANTNLPIVSCFNKQDYNAGRQNWDIDIDKNGVVYFANTNGLLYNVYGEWEFAPVTNNGVVRAVLADDDIIWCGGLDYGFFTKNNGELEYTYLGTLEGRQIWDIERLDSIIYFHAEDKIVQYNKFTKQTTTIHIEGGIWSIINWQGKIWMISRNGQIGYLQDQKFKIVTPFDPAHNSEVRKLIIHNNQMYIVLFEEGIYKFDGKLVNKVQLPESLQQNTFFAATNYDETSYCIGTVNEGFVQISNDNQVIKQVDASHGLIDNTVLSMKMDAYGNIWLGLDYGIAKIEMQSAINTIFDGAATYSILNYNNAVYLATNKGLFRSKNDEKFEFIDKTSGQVWRLKEIDGELFICHNSGLLTLKKETVSVVQDFAGFVDISHFKGTNYYLFSTYHGLLRVKRENGKFKVIDNQNIWGHPKLIYDDLNKCIWAEIKGRDIIKLTLKNDNTIKSETAIGISKVYKTKNGIYFCNGTTVLQYIKDDFIKVDHPLFKPISNCNIKALDVSPERNIISYIDDKELKLEVLLPDGNTHSYSPLLKSLSKNLNEGNEFIDLHNQHLRVATDRGVTVLDIYHSSSFKKQSAPVISSLTVLNDPKKRYTFPYPEKGLAFESGNKDLKFSFSIDKSIHDVVEYRYLLQPVERQWSEWGDLNDEVYYTQLKGDDYTFFLQSRVNGGVIDETELTFTIKKIWYQTWVIIIPVLLIVFLWIFGVIVIMSRISKRKLKRQKQLYVQKNAQKTLEMKNEQLLQYTEIISRKNEFLIKVKSGLESMRNNDAKRWANKIADEVSNEKKEFLFHKLFSEIHQDFINRLNEKYPGLTSNDIRILSFIRINLGNREISNLMNITPRSLDTNRYRLRKKLSLDHDTDLNQFVRNF